MTYSSICNECFCQKAIFHFSLTDVKWSKTKLHQPKQSCWTKWSSLSGCWSIAQLTAVITNLFNILIAEHCFHLPQVSNHHSCSKTNSYQEYLYVHCLYVLMYTCLNVQCILWSLFFKKQTANSDFGKHSSSLITLNPEGLWGCLLSLLLHIRLQTYS